MDDVNDSEVVELELVFEKDVDVVEDPGEEELERVSETVVDDVASVVIASVVISPVVIASVVLFVVLVVVLVVVFVDFVEVVLKIVGISFEVVSVLLPEVCLSSLLNLQFLQVSTT